MDSVLGIVGAFFEQFTALAAVITGTAIFCLPIAIKFTGKTIGFVKSLVGTRGGRRR